MENQWDRTGLCSVPVLWTPATVAKSEILQIKMSFFLIMAFTCTYGWDFCWVFFLLSLNLYILSLDVVLAAYCTSFSFWAGYFPEESWRCLKLKKQPNFLFQMLWQYKNGINFTVAFSCRNIKECVHLFVGRKKKKTYLHHMHFIKAKVFLFFRFNVSN